MRNHITEPVYFFERPPWNRRWVWGVVALCMATLDFFVGSVSGPYIFFPILFVLPVMLMGWNCGSGCAVKLAILLTLARFSFYFVWDHPWPLQAIALGSVLRGSVLVLLAIVTSGLGVHTRALRERVRTLEGILPICMHCKKIRNEQQQWQQLEAYICGHTKADFSHGVCPECLQQHYGELLAKNRNG